MAGIGIGFGGGGGGATTVNKSSVFNYVTKKETTNGNLTQVNSGYMTKILNGVEVVYGSVTATYSTLDATYCRLAVISGVGMAQNACISINARFSAFESVVYNNGSDTNVVQHFVYSENVSSIFLRTSSYLPFTMIGMTHSSRISNIGETEGCGVTSSGAYIYLYAKNPTWYPGLDGADGAIGLVVDKVPNMRWQVNYEYCLTYHDADQSYAYTV